MVRYLNLHSTRESENYSRRDLLSGVKLDAQKTAHDLSSTAVSMLVTIIVHNNGEILLQVHKHTVQLAGSYKSSLASPGTFGQRKGAEYLSI